MLEFVFAGIAAVALMISTVQIGMAMWHYHTLAYAVHETNRYVIVHGLDCGLYGNTCKITVSDVAHKFASTSVGLPMDTVNLTLTPDSGSANAIACKPVTDCYTNANSANQWPPFTDSLQSDNSTVTASYTAGSGIVGLWYHTPGTRIGTITMTSSSKLPIIF